MRAFAITFFVLFCCSVSRADKLCYVGDSQSASAGGLFDKLEVPLSSVANVRSGQAICGAAISSYIKGGQPAGCSYKGITNLRIRDGESRFITGGGTTQTFGSLCQGSEIVVIQLGDNNLADPAGAGKQAADVAKALKARNQKCVWITPASIRGAKCTKQRSQKGAVAVELKTALSGSGCEVIDSFTLTNSNPPMTKDPYCLHYPGKYDEWASAIKPKLLDAINKASSASQKTPSRPVQQRSSR